MKSMVIFVVLLILFSNVYAVEDVDIPETFETGEKAVSDETTYFYAGSKLLASKDSSGVNYHYQDRLGSDVDSKSLPFGQSLKVGERFSFTGKELDEDLYYFNARYYDSNLGRFTSVDPVPSQPAYQYVANNPLTFVDPTGTTRIEPYAANPDNTYTEGYYIDPNSIPLSVVNEVYDEDSFGFYHEVTTNRGEIIRTYVTSVPGGQVSLFEDPVFFASIGGALLGAGSGVVRATTAMTGLPGPDDIAAARTLFSARSMPSGRRLLSVSDEMAEGCEVGCVRVGEGDNFEAFTNDNARGLFHDTEIPMRHTHPSRVYDENLVPSPEDLFNSFLTPDEGAHVIYTRTPTTGDPILIMYRPTEHSRSLFNPFSGVDQVGNLNFEFRWRVIGTSSRGSIPSLRGGIIGDRVHGQLKSLLRSQGY